jgi:peptide/nickel transport system substrate-binding protein
MTQKTACIIGCAALALAASSPAVAQKSKDTLRYPIPDVHTTADTYLEPGRVSQIWDESVYDNLFGYDPVHTKYAPQLVKSWSQPSPTVYELELRDDVRFHDGEKFSADDVVYTVNYVIDPKVKLRFKDAWAFIQSVEKLGPYKVRLTTDGPAPDAIMQLAFGSPMYPKHYHEKFANKEDFGAKPIGTGPYRIVQLDRNKDTIAERNQYYKGYPTKAPAAIGRVISASVQDIGTWVALLLAGEADVARSLPIDQALALEQTGRFKVTLGPPRTAYNFLQMPSAAWKNVKALGDVRVRRAVMMAIDRKALLEQQFGSLAKEVPPFDGLCKMEQIGCGFTPELIPAYDPAGAKKLLAEAGYADGFDVTISVYNDNVGQATMITGMLRAVGIRASYKVIASQLRLKLVLGGQMEIGYLGWSGGGSFTVAPNIVRLFLSEEHDDPQLLKLAAPVLTIMDDTERRKAAAKVFDYYTKNAYGFPMHGNPETFTHSVDLAVRDPSEMRPNAIHPHDFYWK